MNQQEINNFTRMADALEEEIFRLRKDLNESETLVDVLQRELHDARQELKIAHLEKDILRLEKLALEHKLNDIKVPNPYPQPSRTPCDPWQQPWYVGDYPYYLYVTTTGSSNCGSTTHPSQMSMAEKEEFLKEKIDE